MAAMVMATDVLRPMPFSVSSPPHKSTSSPPLLRTSKSTYELLHVINRGSYGVVYKARDRKTGEIVAVKHELSGLSPSTEKEIDILGSLPSHPSIVELKDLTMDDDRQVFVVMEYVEHDMRKLMESRKRRNCPFTLGEVKFLMKQLLEGVALIHDNGVMHRDLKPGNILVDNASGRLKICDFGLSRGFNPRRKKESGRYTARVGTLWYEAPEVLVGAGEYSCAVDMWSVGCIMAEMLLDGRVLFRGGSEIGQLVSIYEVLGKPKDVNHCPPGFSINQTCNMLLRKKLIAEARPLMVTEGGLDLLERCFSYDPKQRITAREALDHRWFDEF